MSKIKEINILTTDRSWWRLLVEYRDDIDDDHIAKAIMTHECIPAGKIWGETMDSIDKPVRINTANIIAIEVIRESEEGYVGEDH